jgi:hypothetical protein
MSDTAPPLYRPTGPINTLTGKTRERRNANRQRLLDAAALLPATHRVSLVQPINVVEFGEISYTYLAADSTYVYGRERSGEEVKHSFTGNGWLAPMMKKLTAVIYKTLSELNSPIK